MKITTLIENRVSRSGLVAEHGLSFFIQHPDANILFDTGQTAGFAINAKAMGIDIAAIDYLIISHGHYDHIGGLSYFIENNEKAKIIVKDETLWPKFKNDKYIGISKSINLNNNRFQKISQVTEIVEGVFIMPNIETFYSADKHMSDFYTQENGKNRKDKFNDELFLALKNDNGISVLSSCSHNGITNIAETARRYFGLALLNIIGGFHINNAENSITNHISDYFNENINGYVFTCHCTGIEKYSLLTQKCQVKVAYNETGNVINL